MLWSRHRHRFNRLAQARWNGTIYGTARVLPRLFRPVVYHGHAGPAPFQPRIRRRAHEAAALGTALLPRVAGLGLFAVPVGFLEPLGLAVAAVCLATILGYAVAIATALPLHRHEPEPLKQRLLVGFFHVAQPLVRTWGRFRAERRPVEPAETPDWYGNRESWLIRLERAAVVEGCGTVRASATDDHDIELRRGPFLGARVTTAVVWNWEPMHCTTFRLRPWPVAAAIGVTCMAGLVSRPAAAVAAGAAASVLAVDALTLRSAVVRALRFTTAQSSTGVVARKSGHDAPPLPSSWRTRRTVSR